MQEDVEDEDDRNDSLLAAVARIPVHTKLEDWKPPPELDEYRLIEPLGRGGMGSVWLAHDRLLDRLVAIKFIAATEPPDAQTRERFALEARAAARLQHPNVVSVYRYGELAERPYLVAEYIRGESLDKLAKPVAWERALELGVALSRGLAAAHRHGIVHRDIKPANAILANDGAAKLVDFGLARMEVMKPLSPPVATELAAGSTDALTAPGTIAGTPRYLSPEVRRGEVADRRSDVYGIGCVLYELLIGKAPILDLAAGSTADGLLPAPPRDAMRSLAGRFEGGAAKLAAIVDRCLSVDPAARYASGDDLREVLEQLQSPGHARGELPEGNPYRGLVAFDAEHRALFFGRGTEIRAVVERLRAEPFVVVAGDSGAGKSSLCRAGVLPAITDGALDRRSWTVLGLVPSHHPIATLAAQIAPVLGLGDELVATRLRDDPAGIVRALRGLGGDAGTLVFVDQLEELCTITDRAEVELFSRVLGELATGGPGVRLLATVRSDFLSRVAELPGVGPEIARAIYLLRPLTAEGAREAIVGPARAKGATFEPALVEMLVASIADATTRIELPLLAFTLAQLWDARDGKTQTISAASLDAIGGVRGALARHADGVLDGLLPEQRTTARKILVRLITPERTRARRAATELATGEALDALVRGRLVVVRGDPPVYELAHERLIDGWPTLAAWVDGTADAIAAHARLTAAVTAWDRLGRSRDALWAQRQLADLDLLDDEALGEAEQAFARASRRAVSRKRWLRRGVAIAIPLIAIGLYATVKIAARRDLSRHIADNLSEGEQHLIRARTATTTSAVHAKRAFAAFDASNKAEGEREWATAFARSTDARAAFAQAARSLEAAFLLDTARDDVRRLLAETTVERIELATREHRTAEGAELETRLGLYDTTGDLSAQRARPARLVSSIVPADARVSIAPGTPLPDSLAPGNYVVIAEAPGRATVRLPIVARAGQEVRLSFELPPAARVPDGFVVVPPGPMLTGSRDDEFIRTFYDVPPMHERITGGFLIGRSEVTYGEWIAFLDAQTDEVRAKHTPQIENSTTVQTGGAIELRKSDRGWELHITPAGIAYVSKGASLTYKERTTRAVVDWKKLPVSGITPDDIRAYTGWLDRTGKVPHARLCKEVEWERAARGPDGRPFPNGEKLAPDDANIDETYGRKDGGFGPDEVGAHPASDSPFGLHDTSGNVWEILEAPGSVIVMRGGGYYTGTVTAHLANRQEIPPTFKHLHVGVRLCAD